MQIYYIIIIMMIYACKYTCLLLAINICTEVLNLPVDTIFLNYVKAFNRVLHGKLKKTLVETKIETKLSSISEIVVSKKLSK